MGSHEAAFRGLTQFITYLAIGRAMDRTLSKSLNDPNMTPCLKPPEPLPPRGAEQADCRAEYVPVREVLGDMGSYGPTVSAVQPWIIGYNGETTLGGHGHDFRIFSRLWIDRI